MTRIGCGKSYEGNQFKGEVGEVIHEGMVIAGIFSAADFIPYFGRFIDVLTGLHGRIERIYEEFDGFFQRAIDDHLDPEKKSSFEDENVIDNLLNLMKQSNKNGGGGITVENIKGLLLVTLLCLFVYHFVLFVLDLSTSFYMGLFFNFDTILFNKYFNFPQFEYYFNI